MSIGRPKNRFSPRNIAKEKGEKRYNGACCLKCNTTLKYVSSRMCVYCHGEVERKRYKENPEVRAKHKIRQKENSVKYNKTRNERRSKNPELARIKSKIWRDKNPDKMSAYNLKHKERRKELNKIWLENNPDKRKLYVKVSCNNRRARRKNIGGRVSVARINSLLFKQWNLCYWCYEQLNDKYEIEHVVPISKGGTNSEENIVIACSLCNKQKHAKLVDEWLKTPNCRCRRKVM